MSARISSTPPGVSTTTGAPAAAIMARSASRSIWPAPRLAWRSAPVPAGSRESLACRRSIRPTIASTRSTASDSSSPAACAWQVSQQKPTTTLVLVADTASQGHAGLRVPAVDDHGGGADGGRRLARLAEDLARAVADVVARRADVDEIGRMDVQRQPGVAQL